MIFTHKTTIKAIFLSVLFTGQLAYSDNNSTTPVEDMSAAPQDLSTMDMGADLSDPVADMGPDDLGQTMPEDMPLDMVDMQPTQDMPGDMTTTEDMPLDMPGDMTTEDMPAEDMSSDMHEEPGEPLAGFGTITGDCQMIDTELNSPDPFFFRNSIDFMMDPYDMSHFMDLTPDGQELLTQGNINVNSLLSEVFAFEILARCEGATFIANEEGIEYYNEMGKITDILVEIDGQRVGVSVVRAFKYPFDEPYPAEEADRILNKKLGDIILSTQNVKPIHAWNKQILSVMAYSPQHADQIYATYQTLPAEVKSDTIVYVTVTNGEDGPVYFNE